MTQEFRIRYATFWRAELRFDSPDDELLAKGILPGWHSFKRSIRKESVEQAAALAFEQASEPKRFV